MLKTLEGVSRVCMPSTCTQELLARFLFLKILSVWIIRGVYIACVKLYNKLLYMERRVLHTDKITIQPAIVGCTLAHPN